MFPEQWAKSNFRVPTGVLKALMWVTRIVILIQASFMINSIRSNPMLLVFNALFLVIAVVYSLSLIHISVWQDAHIALL